jgi:hypothetical protein
VAGRHAPPISKQKQFSWLLTCGDPHSRCRGKRHRFGVVGVYRQRRCHPRICEQIGYHSPLGHTVVPIQRVVRKLAAVPHFFQLRLFVRPASLALHVYVYVHGFSLPSGRNRETINSLVRIQKLFWSPGFANLCTNRPSGVRRGCQIPPRRRLESEQKDMGFAVSSNCRAVECAVLNAERDPLGTAEATVDPEVAYFGAARKFHVE